MRYYGNVMTSTKWRLCVAMKTLWQQQNNKYGKKKTECTVAVADVFYNFNSTVVDWTCFFLSGSRGKECILVLWNLKAAILCSMGWLERNWTVVSAVVVFLHMSTSSLVCQRVIISSRKAMELCSSYVGLSFMLLCLLFIYVYFLWCANWFLLCCVWLLCPLHIVHKVLCSGIQTLFYIRVFIMLQ